MDKSKHASLLKLLRIYLKKVKKRFVIEKAILFGSRARGDYFTRSDVDLIVISPSFKNIPFRARMGKLLGPWKEDIDLEVIGYTPEEFERKKKEAGIVRQAVKEGIEL